MVTWKDVSSFSQSDKERIPNCFRATGGGVVVTIHRHIHYAKDDWLMTCEPWFHPRVLDSKDTEDAKAEAAQKVTAALAAAHEAFGG
jgi:hypothetical protein